MSKTNHKSQITIPQSSSSILINFSGLIGFLLSVYFISEYQLGWSLSNKVVFILLSTAIPIVVLEFIFRPPPLVFGFFSKKRGGDKFNITRVLKKLLALYVIYITIYFIYWLFPEYGSFYQPFWNILLPVLPGLVFLSVPYFFLIDKYMDQPEDGYYFIGSWLLRQCKFKKTLSIQLLLGWLVKLFFLPLMMVYFSGNIQSLSSGRYSWDSVTSSFTSTYDFLWLLIFSTDLVFTCVGYILTLRLLDSHIRSTDQTTLGWFSALICYQPFFSGVSLLYFAYNMDNLVWGDWLVDGSVAYIIWGSCILLLITIYSFSTMMFGIRFSNLTNRGIITNGPYRYFKHPAYLSKNISWWLIAIPFISTTNNVSEMIRSCLLLLCLNGIYYVRAKTEERHLLSDENYQNYTDWIQQHGVFSKFKVFGITKL